MPVTIAPYLRRPELALAVIFLAGCSTSCVDKGTSDEEPSQSDWFEEPVTVTVDLSQSLVTVPPYAFGIHTSVYDNALHDEALPELLEAAGIALLRYPGGGYSDNYHWSTHSMTPWLAQEAGEVDNYGYLAPGSDFGSYVSVLERTRTAPMITVNYGSNLTSDGPGEPKEAAAWVAYANGDPEDETVIGVDGTGHDWQTTGYWASLRAADPLPEEDEDDLNFLRISHPEPLAIQYWEVGNEVFGNGYYGRGEFELDWHVPYDGTARVGRSELSPSTYGSGVVDYVQAMKAVDSSIKVGAVLVTPPMDYGWAPEWNDEVLSQCGEEIDFAIVHWYAANDVGALLRAPQTQVPLILEELAGSFSAHREANTPPIEVAVTELGPNFSVPWDTSQVTGLFAADVYTTFIEHGVSNLDWLELHNGSFLSDRSDRIGPAYNGIRMAHLLAGPGDRLAQTTSSDDGLVAHAALREDGAAGLLLLNTNRATLARVSVEIEGRSLRTTGDVYHYRPEGDAANGVVAGPETTSGLGSSFTVEVPPYSATTLRIPIVE